MSEHGITHEDESGEEAFKFTQRGYMWLNPIKLSWNYCNPAFSLRSLADIAKIAELEKDRDREVLKKEHAFKRERYLIDESLELKQKTFRFYNDEEYWIFQDDGEDYAESLVCPVVMSASQFRRLLNLELNMEAHNLEQQAKGRIDGVSYALNMYCAHMSPREFPAIGKYYAGKLLKEQGQ